MPKYVKLFLACILCLAVIAGLVLLGQHLSQAILKAPNLTKRAKMNQNMGTTDKIIRLAVVVIIAVLYFTGQITGTAAIILSIVAVAFLVTSLIGWCPTYALFGISTKR